VEHRLGQSFSVPASAVGQPVKQMDVGVPIEVTRIAVATRLKDVMEFRRPQPVCGTCPGKPG